MRLRPEQLSTALQKSLAPVYFISGDEPLQLGETADEIRSAAKKAGFSVREVLSVESGFEWNALRQEAGSFSIFAEQKIIDLRIPSGKPGTEGAKALVEYCDLLPADTVLLISAGKLPGSAQKSRWFQALEKVGVVIQVWPLQGFELLQWLQRRSQKKGMQVDAQALKLLASRIEGNLLAAAQEIEKLYILHGSHPISRQAVENLVADSARFDVFKLLDSLLLGQNNRAIRILHGLKAEGVAAPVVLWALSREARNLFNIKIELNQGGNKQSVLKKYQIWDKRKQMVNTALNRLKHTDIEEIILLCAKADRQIKGQLQGDCWESLFSITQLFCSASLMAKTA